MTFGREYGDMGIAKRAAARVETVKADRNTIQLSIDGRTIEWAPKLWGAQIEAFTPVERELRLGDRIEFTRNDYRKARVNGGGGEVTGIDGKKGLATIRADDGQTHRLILADAQDQHIRHAYVQTMHAAQGRTVERVLIHAESGRTNLIDQSSIYVGISRAKAEVVLVTNDRQKLLGALRERSGASYSALTSERQHGLGTIIGNSLA